MLTFQADAASLLKLVEWFWNLEALGSYIFIYIGLFGFLDRTRLPEATDGFIADDGPLA